MKIGAETICAELNPMRLRAGRLSRLFVAGITHRSGSIAALESVHLADGEIRELTGRLMRRLDECVIVSTCNRTEIYGVGIGRPFISCLEELVEYKLAKGIVKADEMFAFAGEKAARHLYRVAASIDSKIVGDPQILGQLRTAYTVAAECNAAGRVLNPLFQRAFKLGKRVRSDTDIHQGAVSIAGAAVSLAQRMCRPLTEKTALVIGAGQTAGLAAESLMKRGVGKLIIANRTRSRAEEVAAWLERHEGKRVDAIGLSRISDVLPGSDIVISATAATEPILCEGDLVGRKRPVLLIDIAMPRNIEPEVAGCPNVVLRNLSDLNDLIAGNYQRRAAAIPVVEGLIESELGRVLCGRQSELVSCGRSRSEVLAT
ncbi:MAG: glutamyl-tRNA reductase [Acidobacteria bacterium]|nr:glutamyl-tRNA reductase [Acidobacteriota bacterium]